jgi:transcription initiation factor TFIIB
MIHRKDKCPECGDNHFFINKERGEVICRTCSFVLEDSMVDAGRERMLDDEDFAKNSRSGAPFDPRVANNLMTEIGTHQDLNKLNRIAKMKMLRLKKKNRWTSTALEQNLNNALINLKLYTAHIGLPEREEKESANIYRECAERGLTRARPSDYVVAAAIYISCRVNGYPKSLNEIASATKVNKKILGKTYKFILRKLNIKLQPFNPIDYVARFSSGLKLSPKTESRALNLIDAFSKKKAASGKSPICIAATALYVSALLNSEKVTQRELAEITGITETTLRNRTKEFVKEVGLRNQLKRKISC